MANAASEDQFDRLPDSVLLLIFNRIGDVKALGRCCVVSIRFSSLIPLVDSVVVRIDCVISDDPAPLPAPSEKARNVFSQIARLVLGGIVRPLQALGQILGRRSDSSSSSAYSSLVAPEVSHHSPTEVLKNFREIRNLRIELPAGELGVDDGVLLKWKAGFGSSLDSCVILGASEDICSSGGATGTAAAADDTMAESFYTNGSLKLRVVWTISSLIAASARHYLLQPIIADHYETLQSLDLTDADGQGVLTMDRRQVQEMRVKPASASGSSSQRTLVPALSMRLWYAPHLDLPGGKVLKGATLVAIRPSEDHRVRDAAADACWISNAFEEPYQTAAVMLLKRRNYCLEMNSF